VRFDDAQPALSGPPLAGQHNEQVLEELGYSDDAVAALTAQGVLWREQR
jgi:crotonobetainyl-CoA:carnitine CoA-transferase CaiB-like acyl-CoA transferase